jgi:hypothetical protein
MKYLIFVSSLLLSFFVNSAESGWKQAELTQSYMQNLTKDQCVAKTIASLKVDDSSEEYIKVLAGISGDCITYAKGTEEQFCKTYTEKYVKGVCSLNILDARDCLLIHVMHQSNCFTKKYK